MGEQRPQAPPQPLHLRHPPSFLNLPPSDRSQPEMIGGQPFTSPFSKGSWNHPFPEERQPQGLLPSLGAAVDQVLIPEKAPGLTEGHKGFRAEPCIYICSTYKTEAAVKHHPQQRPQPINHRSTETLKLYQGARLNDTGGFQTTGREGGSGAALFSYCGFIRNTKLLFPRSKASHPPAPPPSLLLI